VTSSAPSDGVPYRHGVVESAELGATTVVPSRYQVDRANWARRCRVVSTLLAVLTTAGVLAGCASYGEGTTSGSTKAGNGLVGYPAFLPKSTLHYHGDALLVGTAARPALTSQGDPVKVVTPHWSVVGVVTGPEVPGEGLPYQAPATTCTWTVTLSKATASVPISVSDFDTIDDLGNVYQPSLVPGQPVPPSILRPGEEVTFELRVGEPVGEGLMRWAPIGGRVVAKWDFVVEDD
jgi:hypothetical protein